MPVIKSSGLNAFIKSQIKLFQNVFVQSSPQILVNNENERVAKTQGNLDQQYGLSLVV